MLCISLPDGCSSAAGASRRPARPRPSFIARLTRKARDRIAGWARDRRASVAVEFALVGTLLIPLLLFVMIAGLVLYMNQALDYATSKASRQIMTGAAQTAGMSQSAFQTLVCSYLPAAFNCANVIVNVQTVTEGSQPGGYYAFATSNQSWLIIPQLSNSSAQYALGQAGAYQYVQVVYPVTFIPALLSSYFGGATYQGSSAYLVVSTAAFRVEQFN